MLPKITNNDVVKRHYQDTFLNLKLSYSSPLNDIIFITPVFLIITNPEHNTLNDVK